MKKVYVTTINREKSYILSNVTSSICYLPFLCIPSQHCCGFVNKLSEFYINNYFPSPVNFPRAPFNSNCTYFIAIDQETNLIVSKTTSAEADLSVERVSKSELHCSSYCQYSTNS